jgi:hypothetical protein
MVQRLCRVSDVTSVKEVSFRFFHRLANGMQIVASRNDGEKQYESASERADDDK